MQDLHRKRAKHNFNCFYLRNPGCLLVSSEKMIITSEVKLNSAHSFGFVATSFQFWLIVTATNCGSSSTRQQDSKWMLMLLHVCWKAMLTHIPIKNNSVHSQLRSYFCPPPLTMTPVVKYRWRKEEGEALSVHLSLIQGSDGRGDRGALFQQAESCFPRECRTTLWLHWHSGLNAMTQWLPTGSPSAPMSIVTLIKPLSASLQRTAALTTQWWSDHIVGHVF